MYSRRRPPACQPDSGPEKSGAFRPPAEDVKTAAGRRACSSLGIPWVTSGWRRQVPPDRLLWHLHRQPADILHPALDVLDVIVLWFPSVPVLEFGPFKKLHGGVSISGHHQGIRDVIFKTENPFFSISSCIGKSFVHPSRGIPGFVPLREPVSDQVTNEVFSAIVCCCRFGLSETVSNHIRLQAGKQGPAF